MAGLFRHARLSDYFKGESFRDACRRNPNRKNEIQSLDFTTSVEWSEWFRWDSAMSRMPSLHSLYVTSELDYNADDEEGRPGVWEMLEIASEISPNIQRLGFHISFAARFGTHISEPMPRFRGLARLRRLDFDYCEIDCLNLKLLSRSLPNITTISILLDGRMQLINDPTAMDETWLESFSCFRQLNVLRLGGHIEYHPPRIVAHRRIFEFPSLDMLVLRSPSTGWDSSSVLEQLSLPKLRQLELSIDDTTFVDDMAGPILSDRIPQLSVLGITYKSSYPRNFSVAPLFLPLRDAGFTFELLCSTTKPGPDGGGKEQLRWKAKRGEYDGEELDPF